EQTGTHVDDEGSIREFCAQPVGNSGINPEPRDGAHSSTNRNVHIFHRKSQPSICVVPLAESHSRRRNGAENECREAMPRASFGKDKVGMKIFVRRIAHVIASSVTTQHRVEKTHV